jgi:hypothetical protein
MQATHGWMRCYGADLARSPARAGNSPVHVGAGGEELRHLLSAIEAKLAFETRVCRGLYFHRCYRVELVLRRIIDLGIQDAGLQI